MAELRVRRIERRSSGDQGNRPGIPRRRLRTLRPQPPAGGSAVSARAFRDLREFKAWNDSMVEKYDVEQFHNHPSPLIRYIERKRVRRILALLAPRPGDRVLEIG